MNVKFLQEPKFVGSSEYHAIYELVENAEDADEAIAICEEFMERADEIKDAIVKNNP